MNPTQSAPRSAEAALLEADYLFRLHEALKHGPKSEAAEIKENVASHIHAALVDLKTEEVSLTQMARVLEELGPPETMVTDPVEDSSTAGFQEKSSSPTEEGDTFETPISNSKAGDHEFLDRLFVGYLIVTFGLFVPVIELHFCAIIGLAIIWRILAKAPTIEIGGAKQWAAIATLTAAAMCPAALLTLAEKFFGLLYLPIGIAWIVSDVVLFWIIFGGLANWLEEKHMGDQAQDIRNRRIYYILANLGIFLIAIPVGILLADSRNAMTSSLAGYALLPLSWLINWFLILKPILEIRKKIQ